MPAFLTSRLQSSQEEQPLPSWDWPEFRHPAPVTLAALALALTLISILVTILWQIVRLQIAQRRGFVLVGQHVDAQPIPESSHRNLPGIKEPARPVSIASHLEIEARQLLFGDIAAAGERMPLCSADKARVRASLYDTFQVPHPHTKRLKFSRSMMELNGGSPLEGGDDGEGAKKAKTIHLHGVNRLNTAWAWMS